MTSPVPDTTEDCPDVGTSVLSQIDSFLDKIQPMLDELQSLKTNLKSPSSSQSKTLVKQVWYCTLLLHKQAVLALQS